MRKATPDDIEQIVDLGRRFHASTHWSRVEAKDEDLANFALGVMQNGVIFLDGDGMCGGVMTPAFFNKSVKVAAELFWYATTGGKQLRSAFEEWGRENGASFCQFSGLESTRSDSLDRLYRMAGYGAVEMAYLKVL